MRRQKAAKQRFVWRNNGSLDLSQLNLDSLNIRLGENGTYYYGTERVNSGSDFLQRFGDYRALYIKSVEDKRSLQYRTSLVNRIIKFVETNKYVLSKSEKAVCSETLAELREITKDKYLARLIQRTEQDL